MPERKKSRLSQVLDFRRKVEEDEEEVPLLPPPPAQVYMPEGIKFEELWKDEEPETSNFIQLVLLFVIAAFSFVGMIFSIIH